MSNVGMFLILGIFLSVYALLNFYIGLRGRQFFGQVSPVLGKKLYWLFFWFIALSYLAGRIGQRFLPDQLAYWLTLIGAYWLGAMIYFFCLLIIIDLVRLLDYWVGVIPFRIKQQYLTGRIIGIAVISLVAAVLVYGTWNARNPVVTHYNLTIDKKAGNLSQLHVVMVSDIHLGEIIHNGRLMAMVKKVNELNPDVVLLPGDIIDENVGPVIEQRMNETFRELTPKYGTYAVPGNHDYNPEAIHYIKGAGIKVLQDSYTKVASSFYIVGRDNEFEHGPRNQDKKQGRLDLATVMQGVDHSLPIILLDHQPKHLDEAQKNGVDLQLSGHTHKGQLFPGQFITSRIYEIDWGLLRKADFQTIVSSGFGTWGPPVRIGNHPEIVDITITFAKK